MVWLPDNLIPIQKVKLITYHIINTELSYFYRIFEQFKLEWTCEGHLDQSRENLKVMSGCSGPEQLNSDYHQTLSWYNLSGQHISVFDPSHCGMWICSCIANMSFPTWKLCSCLLLCTSGSGLALPFPYNTSSGSWRMQSALPLAVFSSGCTNCSLSSPHTSRVPSP